MGFHMPITLELNNMMIPKTVTALTFTFLHMTISLFFSFNSLIPIILIPEALTFLFSNSPISMSKEHNSNV